MLHARATVVLALLALGAASTAGPPEAWAKKGKKGVGKKASRSKAARKAARMEKVGKRAYVKGRYDDALIAFEAAFAARPQPKHLYNMARCHEKPGSRAKAAAFYERYVREAPNAEDREEVETRAEFLTTKLKKTMGRLVVTSPAAGAGLRVHGQGRTLDVITPWSGWLPPGRYDVSVLLPDDREFQKLVALAAGQERTVEAREPAVAEPVAAASAQGNEPPPAPSSAGAASVEPGAEASGRVPAPAPGASPGGDDAGVGAVPLAALGLGAAALVSWGVFGGLALSAGGEFDDGADGRRESGRTQAEMDDLARSANLYGALANVSLVVAAAAGLTGGAILLLSSDDSAASAGVRWSW